MSEDGRVGVSNVEFASDSNIVIGTCKPTGGYAVDYSFSPMIFMKFLAASNSRMRPGLTIVMKCHYRISHIYFADTEIIQ